MYIPLAHVAAPEECSLCEYQYLVEIDQVSNEDVEQIQLSVDLRFKSCI